jgi:hypothetical protein
LPLTSSTHKTNETTTTAMEANPMMTRPAI